MTEPNENPQADEVATDDEDYFADVESATDGADADESGEEAPDSAGRPAVEEGLSE